MFSACSVPSAASSSPFPGLPTSCGATSPPRQPRMPWTAAESIHRGLCKMRMDEMLPGLLRWSREAALPQLGDQLWWEHAWARWWSPTLGTKQMCSSLLAPFLLSRL